MNSKIIIISLVITMLSLLFIILSYYGIIRLCKLKIGKCDSFAKDYIKLSKASSNKKIILSLYGKSIDTLRPTINSLLDQTVRPDQIIISVPEGVNIELDPYIKDNKIIIVHKLAKDYKSCCSFMSPLTREKDGDTIVILANENTIYGPDFIEAIVNESEKHPDCIIFVSKYNARIYSVSGKKVTHDADIIDSSLGVLLKPKFFPADILDDKKFIDDIDVMLGVQIAENNICTRQLSYSENFSNNIFDSNKKNNINLHAIDFPSFK